MVVRMLQKFQSLELDPKDKGIPVGAENHEVTLVIASTSGCRVRAVE